MMLKIIGAAMIILACGGFGFAMAVLHRREVKLLRSLLSAIHYMKCELQFHCTPLPELCRKTASASFDCIGKYFKYLGQEFESQVCPDIKSCSMQAITKTGDLPQSVRDAIMVMTNTLGTFDLVGQLDGLEETERYIEEKLNKLTADQDVRLRNYQTLSLCAGAALAILLV